MAPQRWDLCLDHLREIHSYRLRLVLDSEIEFAAIRSINSALLLLYGFGNIRYRQENRASRNSLFFSFSTQ
jgi:hypothetical protein